MPLRRVAALLLVSLRAAAWPAATDRSELHAVVDHVQKRYDAAGTSARASARR